MKDAISNFLIGFLVTYFIISLFQFVNAYTESDLKDVYCLSYCQNRDYNMGWSIPTGCRCSDDFKLADKPFKLPSNLHGRMVGDTPPTYYIIRETQ